MAPSPAESVRAFCKRFRVEREIRQRLQVYFDRLSRISGSVPNGDLFDRLSPSLAQQVRATARPRPKKRTASFCPLGFTPSRHLPMQALTQHAHAAHCRLSPPHLSLLCMRVCVCVCV